MKKHFRVTGPAAVLALVALIVAIALAASHATAPGRAELSTPGRAAVPVIQTAAPVVQTAGTSEASEASDPAVCGSPGADPGNCSYE